MSIMGLSDKNELNSCIKRGLTVREGQWLLGKDISLLLLFIYQHISTLFIFY